MPRVSVVIPTRNRAPLLKVALQSALRQTWQDLEILVSDNYCENEETKKVYESFQDSRLRYVRTDRLLAMPDSWEFALSHAKGQYVTFLTDDSYLLPFAIERAAANRVRNTHRDSRPQGPPCGLESLCVFLTRLAAALSAKPSSSWQAPVRYAASLQPGCASGAFRFASTLGPLYAEVLELTVPPEINCKRAPDTRANVHSSLS